jgi:hypothetical protein
MFDERSSRPGKVDLLIEHPTKAQQTLGWESLVTFEPLVQLMVDADLQVLGLVTFMGGALMYRCGVATLCQNLIGSRS